jgi:hypothetical protein
LLLFVCSLLVCVYVHVWILCEYAHAVKPHDISASVGLSSAAWPDKFSWFIYTICFMSHARAQTLFLYTATVSFRRFEIVVFSARGSRMLLAFHAFMPSHALSCDCPCRHLVPLRVHVNVVVSSEPSGKVIVRCLIFLYVVPFSDPLIHKQMDTPPTNKWTRHRQMDTPPTTPSPPVFITPEVFM